MTASPSGPTPCKRYTVRWDRVLLALNLAGVIRSGTTRSGLSRRHAWPAALPTRPASARRQETPLAHPAVPAWRRVHPHRVVPERLTPAKVKAHKTPSHLTRDR